MTEATTNPFVGPRTFTYAERDHFFGREREARELLARVISERLTLFYAQSGAGKSSLINTRLIPQLQAENFAVLPVGRVSGTLPEGVGPVDNIFAFNLMLSLDQSQGDPRRFSHMRLSHFLARLTSPDGEQYFYDADAEAEALRQAQDMAEVYEPPPAVLIIDQFEEIVTAHPEYWPQRAEFFHQLDEAMAADPLLWVVLSMREDYVATLEPYSSLVADKLRARFYMQRMGYQAALEAIRRPAELGSRPFTPGVAEALVDNLRQVRMQTPLPLNSPYEEGSEESPPLQGELRRVPGQFVEPVQLQVVCYQLWENLKGRPTGPITAEDLDTLGNVDTALAEFYEQVLRKTLAVLTPPLSGEGSESPPLSSQERAAERGRSGPERPAPDVGDEVSELRLRRWFDQELITEAGTRGTVYQGHHDTAGLPNEAVKLLADQFLLRAELRAGGTWYELVHDRFVEPIQQANREWEAARLQRNPLAAPAAAWQNDPAKLLEGAQLQAAQTYAAANPLDVTAEERAFLQESLRREMERAEQAHQARRRNITIAVALVVVAIAMAALAVWGFTSAEQAVQKANEAATAQAEAETQKAAAETAATQVAQQNEKTQAELNFYLTTDPQVRLAELHSLFNQPDPQSQAKARQLFFTLPKVDQVLLLRVADDRLLPIAQAVLPNLADVNRTGYTDEHLQALLETLPSLSDAGALPAQLEVWLAARQMARAGQFEAAQASYDELIKQDNSNPAWHYERAGVLAALDENQAALADLEQVIALAQAQTYPVAGALPAGPEFASGKQMIEAARQLMMVYSNLIDEFKASTAKYASLAEAKLVFRTVITDAHGIPLVQVPAGSFKMGSNNAESDEQPVHQVYLDEFYIDQYEVTNAQFATFLREQGNQEEGGVPWLTETYSRLSEAGKKWQIAAGYTEHPVTGVSWFGAKAYCTWRDGQLPTEAQWEKAARGSDQRTYPWGEQITCELANYYPSDSDTGCVGDTTPVGMHPAGVSPYGAYDMAGNVWEWVQSEYKEYPYRADDGRENLDSTNVRVLRGGSWDFIESYARASYRGYYPFDQIVFFGFRCVAAAP